jgi:hypothetical protein
MRGLISALLARLPQYAFRKTTPSPIFVPVGGLCERIFLPFAVVYWVLCRRIYDTPALWVISFREASRWRFCAPVNVIRHNNSRLQNEWLRPIDLAPLCPVPFRHQPLRSVEFVADSA